MNWLVRSLLGASVCLVGVMGVDYWQHKDDEVEVTVIDFENPPDTSTDDIVDDRPEKHPLEFDEDLVDSRPLGQWQINQSAAIFKLDVPALKPEKDDDLLTLYGSYAEATARVRELSHHGELLPSVNMLDGKAKQFDDGLHAALDHAYYQGLGVKLGSQVQWVRRLYEKGGKDNPAAPFLAAGLELAGVKVAVADVLAKEEWLRRFQTNEAASKPIGFYPWNPNLMECFRFMRFFQTEFSLQDLTIPLALNHLLAQDKTLAAEYAKVISFYGRLTNPSACLSIADLSAMPEPSFELFVTLCRTRNAAHEAVALFPASGSREQLLFEKLFPEGLPENADLLRELIKRIRSGEIDLRPRFRSGWYDHQAYALEALLLPEKGAEYSKLVLTRSYKLRLLEAFQALMTKRRETQARQLEVGATTEAAAVPDLIKPRFRVEPCPTYYLRTARAYAFLLNFLEATVGKDALSGMHGLRKEGKREKALYEELQFMRDLFYGCYFTSLEDLGMKPELAKDEPVVPAKAILAVDNWLLAAQEGKDKDLAAPTYAAVPIFIDETRRVTRVWLTLGVRLVQLDASYVMGPRFRNGEFANWQQSERYQLGTANYLIGVDESAEVELNGLKVLTRDELKAVCDREKTKEAIVKALKSQ